jgi:phage N-6-adenine-methyltransferase
MPINAAFDGEKLPMIPVDQPVAALTYYEDACRAVAQAKKVDEVSKLRDVAEGMRAYARQAKNKQLEIEAAEIRFRAERRLGQLIEMQRPMVGLAKGTRGQKLTRVSGGAVATPPGNDLPTLEQAGIDKNLAKLARKCAAVPDEKFENILAERRATIEAANAKVTVDLLGGSKLRGTQGTGENEWYTPADIIGDVRKVLGAIDLDPASSDQAQRTVQAARYFTLNDDGLARPWHGNVWLNPPYAQPHIESFADKMIAEIVSGHVASAIMLTHNYTDTGWFHKLAAVSEAICFTKGRIRFEAPDGTLAAPTQGQAFFYFGKDVPTFSEVFAPLGFVT